MHHVPPVNQGAGEAALEERKRPRSTLRQLGRLLLRFAYIRVYDPDTPLRMSGAHSLNHALAEPRGPLRASHTPTPASWSTHHG